MLKIILADLRSTFGFFTLIPVAPAPENTRTLADAAWAFPVVGAGVGAAGGAVFAAASALGFSAGIAAWLAIAAQLLLTRALHEDGLSDMVDGFGGGRDKASRLAIMRDSRIGSFGAVALIIALSLRASALASFADWHAVFIALIVAGMFSRTAMMVLMWRIAPARSDGMAVHASRPKQHVVMLTVTFTVAVALLLVHLAALAAWLAAIVVTYSLGHLAKKRIGGITGDVCGATQQLVEIAVLLCLARP